MDNVEQDLEGDKPGEVLGEVLSGTSSESRDLKTKFDNEDTLEPSNFVAESNIKKNLMLN